MGLTNAFVQSSLTVGLTSIVPLLIFFLLRPVLQNSSCQTIILSGLVSLAVGSLLGDVFFHLLPEIFDSKGYYLRNCSLMLLGVFIFFVGERVLQHYHHGHGHDGHLRVPNAELRVEEGAMTSTSRLTQLCKNGGGEEGEEEGEEELELTVLTRLAPTGEAMPLQHGDRSLAASHDHYGPAVGGTKPMGLLVLTSDFIHNFVDGIAIGISFATSTGVGVSTAVAVFLHEIPHELGDFAILLAAGYTPTAIVICNILTTVSSFVGIIVAILLVYWNQGDPTSTGTFAPFSENIQPAILSLTAGNFLYIALADLVPELLHSHLVGREGELGTSSVRQRTTMSLIQYGGILLGASTMLVIKLISD